MAKQAVAADDVGDGEKELSLREQIEAARDEVLSRQEEAESANSRTEPGTGHEPDRQTGEGNASGRSPVSDRETNGRFKSSAKEKTADAPGGRTEVQEGTSGLGSGNKDGSVLPQSGTQQSPPVTQESQPPSSWKAEEKALWQGISSDVKAVIQRREADVRNQMMRQGQVAAVGNEFMQVANEFAPVVQARGGNPVAMFRDFMRIMDRLNSAPDAQTRAAVFQQVAAQQGVDLRALGIPPQAQVPGQTNVQPPHMQPQNIPLLIQQAMDQRFNTWQAEQARVQEQAEMARTNSEIEAFKNRVNEQGMVSHPHFDTVQDLMSSLLMSGVAQNLDQAYSLAVKAHPETSAALEAEAKAAAKKAEEQRQAAQVAKRKAGSVRGGPGSGAVAANGAGDRSLREELQAAFAENRSRI